MGFPHAPGLRPTADRVRETLFNWLQGRIHGSRCLDLFAGSGALGFEAASRGAAQVVMVEASRTVADTLRTNAEQLGARMVHVQVQPAQAYLRSAGEPFDLVFLDPPFGKGLLEPALQALATGGWLRPDAHVYIECEARHDRPALPQGLTWVREGRAGEVAYFLTRKGA